MYALKFKEKVCATCPSADCLLKCQYMSFSGHKEAHAEMMKVVRGKDSRVLHECATCYACEEYCKRGNHPFYLISERREEKGMFTAPRPITNQWINMTRMQGKYMVGEVKDKALSCCYHSRSWGLWVPAKSSRTLPRPPPSGRNSCVPLSTPILPGCPSSKSAFPSSSTISRNWA